MVKKTLYVAGHRGMVGSALMRRLAESPRWRLLTANRDTVDCTQQAQVRAFLRHHRPDAVVVAAAKVGGIHGNRTFPAEFIYRNLAIAANLVHESYAAGVPRLLFLGSSCIYPRLAEQPMQEDALLTGPLEPTNEPYAVAKIAGLKLCQYYRRQYDVAYTSLMPTNLYGPGDNYHPEHSHVLPGLLRRFHEAKLAGAEDVVVWGSGTPKREFLHVDDLADAIAFLLPRTADPDWLNAGSGEEVSIRELAELVSATVGFEGRLVFDPSKPDGTPRKLMDSSRLRALGWSPRLPLAEGIRQAYASFQAELTAGTLR